METIEDLLEVIRDKFDSQVHKHGAVEDYTDFNEWLNHLTNTELMRELQFAQTKIRNEL